MLRLVSLSFLLLLGFLAGCSSYDTQVARGRSLTGVQRFFVLSNPNDNHALDHQIAAALTNRGFQAESGPLTMMPEETQAIVTYQDHWTWDFGDHLVYLQISVRDQKTNQSYASVEFSAKVPTSKPLAVIADDLVGRLVSGKP
jgi:hypothetical protein